MKHTILPILLLFTQIFYAQDAAEIYVCPPCNSTCDTLEFDTPGTCHHCTMELVSKTELDMQLENQNKTIAFYLQDGVEVLDFAGPMEVFSYAGFKVFTVSKTKNPIKSQGILNIIPDYDLNTAPQADILAFFGGNASAASQDEEVISWVKQQEHIDYYFSVCTGAFILAEAGILENKTATTFHSALEDLKKNYPKTTVLKNARYVDNGQIITTAGISAGIDGALHLVAKLQGFNNARKVAYHIEYDKWTPGEGQLLTDNSPYKFFHDLNNLQDYLGLYEFENNSQVEIKYNDRENSIYAYLNGQNYPLFYISEDRFMSVNGEQVIFERNSNGVISGYRQSKDSEVFYSRLD